MAFDVNFWGLTFDFAGKVLLAVMALLVHYKVGKEKKIDMHVIKEMRLEIFLGILSIVLFIASYILLI